MTSPLYRFLKRFTKHLINIKDFGGNSVSRMIWIRGRKRRGKVTLVRLDDDWRWECLQHQWRFIYRQWVVSSKEHLGFYSKNWFEHLPPIIAIFQNCPPHCDNLIIIIITIHEAVHWSVCGCALNGPFDNGQKEEEALKARDPQQCILVRCSALNITALHITAHSLHETSTVHIAV